MARGGKREGAGRKPGAKSKATKLRELIQTGVMAEAAATQTTPLQVFHRLIGENLDAREAARQVLDEAEAALALAYRGAGVAHSREVDEENGLVLRVLKNAEARVRDAREAFLAAERRAKDAADSAAPYCHGRIQTVDMTHKGPLVIGIATFDD